MTTVDEVLARARTALGRSTLYWLGEGGKDGHAALPSSRLAVGRLWPGLPAEQHEELGPLAAAIGIDVHDPSLVVDACDCSGFVCWALGFARRAEPAPYTTGQGWINTDTVWADAMGRGARFQRLERARPGALVVYPSNPPTEKYGHVGIVIEADATGRATLVAHCAKANVLAAPFDAIKITAPDAFEAQTSSVYAWCREVV